MLCDIRQSAKLALQYVARNTAESGKFLYTLDFHGQVHGSYNMLRHAATVEETSCWLDGEEAKGLVTCSLRRATRFLSVNILDCPWNDHCKVIQEEGTVKLGSVAMAIVAMLARGNPGSPDTNIAYLVRYVIYELTADRYVISKRLSDGTATPFKSSYYIAQAIIALFSAFRVYARSDYAEVAMRGLRAVLTDIKQNPATALNHWNIRAIAKAYKFRAEPELETMLRRYCYLSISRLSRHLTFNLSEDVLTTHMCTEIEGLASAIAIVGSNLDLSILNEARRLSVDVLGVCKSRQFDRCCGRRSANHLIGGVSQTGKQTMVRIDFVQHFLGACRGVMQIGRVVNLATSQQRSGIKNR